MSAFPGLLRILKNFRTTLICLKHGNVIITLKDTGSRSSAQTNYPDKFGQPPCAHCDDSDRLTTREYKQ